MILVDTSVWADHLRKGDPHLAKLLNDGLVLMHPFVRGEIALGNLRSRISVLESFAGLPHAVKADDAEVLAFIDTARLHGTGIGWVDAHLLASAKLSAATLWTRDKKLAAAAAGLGLNHDYGSAGY